MPERQKTRLQRAVAVWNDSGGVGKTTTAVNVAEALARQGEDTLVIDLDPQYGGLTDHAGYEAALDHPRHNLVDIFLNDSRSLDEAVISEGESEGLSWDLIPAHSSLEEFDGRLTAALGPRQNRLLRLRKSIKEAGLHTQYEYLLVDCRASRGPLVANAVSATLNVLIPTELSRKGATAVDGLVNYVEEMQRDLRNASDLPSDVQTGVTAIVPNNCAKTGQLTNSEKEALSHLHRKHEELLPQFYIPSRTALADAWRNQMPLAEYISRKDSRNLRANEKTLPDMFELIAKMVQRGGPTEVDDAHVANIPQTLTLPEDSREESPEDRAPSAGDA